MGASKKEASGEGGVRGCSGEQRLSLWPSQGSGHLPRIADPQHPDSGQTLWVGGLMPVGNSLVIINTSNHLSVQWEGRVQPEPCSPRKLWLPAVLLPLPKGLGKAGSAAAGGRVWSGKGCGKGGSLFLSLASWVIEELG